MADFFAYFNPKKRLGSHDILFLICCPAHQREKEKHELEKAGLTPYYDVVTSNIKMIPGHDRAFVFVSGGINFASSEDMAGGFYLRLVQILSKGKRINAVLSKCNFWARRVWFLLHHPCWMCLKCLGARFHCFGSFLLIWYPSFQIMPQEEQSGVPKAKATRKAPLSVAATSEAAFTNLRKIES